MLTRVNLFNRHKPLGVSEYGSDLCYKGAETKAQRVCHLPKVTQLVKDKQGSAPRTETVALDLTLHLGILTGERSWGLHSVGGELHPNLYQAVAGPQESQFPP